MHDHIGRNNGSHWEGLTGLTVCWKPINDYFRDEAYWDVLPTFRETFGKIVTERGSTVTDTRARFGNRLMDGIIFGPGVDGPGTSGSNSDTAGGSGRGKKSRPGSAVVSWVTSLVKCGR